MSALIKSLSFLRMGRFWLGGPLTLIGSILMMASMSLWFPKGVAGINHLAFPLILFPLLWSAMFFYVVLESNVKRAALVVIGLVIINGALVAASVTGYWS